MYNKIYKNQQVSTLEEIEKVLDRSSEFQFNININNIVPYYKQRANLKEDKEQEQKYWEHIIAIMIMSQLKEKYNISSIHNIEEERKILTRDDFSNYKDKEEVLLNRNDAIEAIKQLKVPKLHIMLRYLNNEQVWNELMNYLKNDLGIMTNIFSDGEIPLKSEEHIPDKCYIIDKNFNVTRVTKEKQYEKTI